VPKFVFNLEGVLRQRKHVEQERQRELALRLKVLADAESELRRLRDSVQQSNDDLRQNHLTGPLDMSFLAAHRRFLLATQRQAGAIGQRIATAQQQVDEARKRLAEAAMQRKVIERLREKHYERWRAEQGRKESAELDEIGTQISYRNLADAEASAVKADTNEAASS
jgi:flagellar FliJ protein